MKDRRVVLRGIKNFEIARLIGISVISVLGGILVALDGHTNMGFNVGLAPITISLAYYVSIWTREPDYFSKHGVAIWSCKGKVKQKLMEMAFDQFLAVLATERPDINQSDLSIMLGMMSIEWITSDQYRRHYHKIGKDDNYYEYRLVLQWDGSVAMSELYHELLHMVNRFVLFPNLKTEHEKLEFIMKDLTHADPDWWRLVGVLCDDY